MKAEVPNWVFRVALPAALTLLLPVSWRVAAASDTVGDGATGVHWPSFRGPLASGVARGYPTPTRWKVDSGENVRWKTPIPGLGLSSPVVWADRVFVTTAVREKGTAELVVGLYGSIQPVEDDSVHRWNVYCVHKRSGKILWERNARVGRPQIKRHPKSSHANPSPATDGKRVVAFFGSEGLYCYSVEGELIWKKDLGVLDSGYFRVPPAQWGFGSSPVIHDGKVILQCDVQKDPFIALLDLEDGKEICRTRRDDVPTWSTPTVLAGKRTQIVVNGYRHIGGYDLETGEEIWRLRGGGDIPVPTPVVGGGLIFITGAHGGAAPIYAVRTSARGDITPPGDATSGEHLAWSTRRGGNYMQTPLVDGDLLYACSDRGILSCLEARTGEVVYRQRLGSGGRGFTASIVAADGKIYVTGEDGDVHVVRAGREFRLLETNQLGGVSMATPAISEGVVIFRTAHHLIAVSGGK